MRAINGICIAKRMKTAGTFGRSHNKDTTKICPKIALGREFTSPPLMALFWRLIASDPQYDLCWTCYIRAWQAGLNCRGLAQCPLLLLSLIRITRGPRRRAG